MARTKQQAIGRQHIRHSLNPPPVPGMGAGPRGRLPTREDGFDHRHADERDRRVLTARSAEHMVFKCPLVMNIVGSHVKGNKDKLGFGCINKVTEETKYRKDAFKEKLRDSFRKDAYNEQTDEYGLPSHPPSELIPYKPDEKTSREALATHLYGHKDRWPAWQTNFV